jgi:hypothetical protein
MRAAPNLCRTNRRILPGTPARDSIPAGCHRGADRFGKILAGRVAGPQIWRRSPGVRFDAGLSRVRHRHIEAHARRARGVPHHLLDLVDPAFPFTAGEYRARAVASLEDLRQRARLPILTVGTGLYLRALLEGLADAPARSEELRARLEAAPMRTACNICIASCGAWIPKLRCASVPRDRPKMIRAIEVCLLTGRPLTEVHPLGPHAPRRLPPDQDRPAASARRAVRPHRAPRPHHARTRLARGGGRPGSQRRSLKIRSRSTSSGTANCARTSKAPSPSPPPRAESNFPGHAPLRQAPAHLVPQRSRSCIGCPALATIRQFAHALPCGAAAGMKALPHPDFSAAISRTFRRRPVSLG